MIALRSSLDVQISTSLFFYLKRDIVDKFFYQFEIYNLLESWEEDSNMMAIIFYLFVHLITYSKSNKKPMHDVDLNLANSQNRPNFYLT